jgi:vacuolar-type H+-ATPase subunit I/STV1
MKQYSNTMVKDPIRNGYQIFQKPNFQKDQRLENEIQMRQSFYQTKQPPFPKPSFQKPNELLPKGDDTLLSNTLPYRQPVTDPSQRMDSQASIRDITSFTNEKNKVNTMVQEIFEKDKEIQKCKNELEVCNEKVRNLEAEKQQFKSNEMEVILLQDKLKEKSQMSEQFEELVKQHNQLVDLFQDSQETIQKLKEIIRKQNTMLNPDYKHDQLRELLKKYHPDVEDETIQSVFETLKVTEDMEITKELLQAVMSELRD